MNSGQSGNELTSDERDEMLRSMLRIRARASAGGMKHDSAERKVQIRRELLIREIVYKHVDEPEVLAGDAITWRVWMIQHAQMQVARYSREISESDFREMATRLRRWRDSRDRKTDSAWLKWSEVA